MTLNCANSAEIAVKMIGDGTVTVDLSGKRLAEIPKEVLTICNSISVLVLSENKGIRLHGVLRRFKSVRSLALRSCDLVTLPDDLLDFTRLEELNLSDNDFSGGLDPAVGRLRMLRKLSLTDCKLRSMPHGIEDLPALEELDLSNNDFSDVLNGEVGQLRTLKKLVLTDCNLRRLPESIGNLQALEELVLWNNDFSDGLNPVVGRLRALRKLVLGKCALQSVPDWIGDLEALEELDLQWSCFSGGLNPNVGRLHTLRKLNLRLCSLRSVPDCLGDLEALEDLELSGNDFSRGFYLVGDRLHALRKLNLKSCNMQIFPNCLGDLKALAELDLSKNKFSDGINPAVGRLRSLIKLNLTECNLKYLPDEMGNLQALSDLDLSNNYFKDYQPCLLRMTNLEVLDVSQSHDNALSLGLQKRGIKHLPVELAFTRLRKLWLCGHDITEPPLAILVQGIEVIKLYLRALIPGGQLLLADTINMMGETGAGKTSIAESLVARSPRPTAACNRTRVMQQLRMCIEKSTIHCVNINDFGGHQIYHSVMPIFLPTNGLVILAFDATDESQKPKVKHWLLTALAKSREIRILIAATHADKLSDEERMSLEEQMQAFSSGILETATNEVSTHISCIESRPDKESISMLDKFKKLFELHANFTSAVIRVVTLSCSAPDPGLGRLRELVEELLHAPETLPASWCRVINEIKTANAEDLFITRTQVENFCKEYISVDKELPNFFAAFRNPHREVSTAILRYLNKTSQIIWVENHPQLHNYIFHSPQRIINACKEILHHDIDSRNLSLLDIQDRQDYERGILCEPLLRTLLKVYEGDLKRGREQFARPDSQVFDVVVDFLEQFNIISHITTKSEGRQFIVPCKLSPMEPPKFKEHKQIAKSCPNRVTVRLSFIGSVVPLSFFETSLASMLTVAGDFPTSYVCPWRYGLIFVNDEVYFVAKLKASGVTLTAFSKSTDKTPWTALQPMLSRLNDNAVASWHGAPPSCYVRCPWCTWCRYHGEARGESEVGEIKVDVTLLALPTQLKNTRQTCPDTEVDWRVREVESLLRRLEDARSSCPENRGDSPLLASPAQLKNKRPTCPKCLRAIPVSLCFPASQGSLADDQKEIREFFGIKDGTSAGNVGWDDNTQCSELTRRLRKATPLLVQGLDRHSVYSIVDALLAARDGEGLITNDHRQEIEAESTDSGKARKLLYIVSNRGDEAIRTLALSLKCEGVRRPDLAKLILEPPLM